MVRIISNKPSITIMSSTEIDPKNISAHYYKSEYINVHQKLNKSGLKIKKMRELAKKISLGNTGKIMDNYVEEGIPYLTTKNISDQGLDLSKLTFITKETHEKILSKSRVYPGDIIYNKSGNVGLSAILTQQYKEYNLVSDLIYIRPDVDKVNPYYLVLFLNSSVGKKLSEQQAGGSIFQHISIYDVQDLKIALPVMEIQQYIGNKVRKAEELREEAKQLMSQVYELINIHFSLDSFENEIKDNYKYDFVSSNYLEDRLDAEYYDPNLIKLFTHLSKMGFKFVNLGNVSRMVFTGENVESTWIAPDKKVPLIYIGNLEGYFVIPSDSEFIDENNVRNWEKSFAEFGDILFASRGSLDCLINRISVYFDEDKKGVITSNIIAVRLDQNLIRPGYVISVLKSIIGTYQIIKHSWGVAQKGLTANDVSKIVIPLLQINEQLEIEEKLIQSFKKLQEAKKLINEAKQDVEDLIEGKFDESKISEGV